MPKSRIAHDQDSGAISSLLARRFKTWLKTL